MNYLLLKRLAGVWLLLLLYILPLPAQVRALTSASPVTGATLEVYFINVLQGNCILVKTPAGKFMLYDAGSTSSAVDPTTIAAYVRKITGGADITTIILSHPDEDHVNFITSIPEAQRPLYVHFSGSKTEYDPFLKKWFSSLPATTKLIKYPTNYSSTNPTTNADLGPGVSLYVLAANVASDANSRSIVASVDYKDNTVLLTGDATSVTERWILKTWDPGALKSTIYSFGHHGSNSSNNKGFLNAVSPNIGIFSASAAHRGYGHPRCVLVDYVEHLVDSGGRGGVVIPSHRIDCWDPYRGKYVTENNDLGVFLTATQGNIIFKCDGNNYQVDVDKLK